MTSTDTNGAPATWLAILTLAATATPAGELPPGMEKASVGQADARRWEIRHCLDLGDRELTPVSCGYSDLATPFFAAEYTMHHLGLELELRDKFRLVYYPGHMMYVDPPSRRQLKEDIVAFIGWSIAGGEG